MRRRFFGRRHCIKCVRSPYIIKPIFKWLFWRQLHDGRRW